MENSVEAHNSNEGDNVYIRSSAAERCETFSIEFEYDYERIRD
jgi:hypothetical protein